MKITFTHEAWKKINAYIKLTDEEISGLGISSINKAGDEIIIRDVRIWEQECTAMTTEIIDNKHLIDAVEEYKKEGVPMEDMNVWWHSHVNMDVFWSNTDQETIDNWFNEKYLVAVVGNKKKEFKGQISLKKPFKFNINNVDIEYEPEPEDSKYEMKILKDIDKKIIEKETEIVKWNIKDNNHDLYQRQTNHMNRLQKKEFLKSCAIYCNCKECKKYIKGKRKKFPFKSHIYDAYDQIWKSIELFNNETMDKRQTNLNFSDDWEQESRWQKHWRGIE